MFGVDDWPCSVDNRGRADLFPEIFLREAGIKPGLAGLLYAGV
jgi:hypothetical protein